VRDHGQTLVLNTLRRLMQTPHRQVVQEHGQQCQRDMLFTLEYVSKGILLQDEDGFMEDYLVWMQNIIRSFKRQSACVVAYRLLKEEVRSTMPGDQSNLMVLYLDKLTEALDSGV
jgi:gluconate kinase